ncbi:hypothetical protein MPSEU_000069200 [Mayamaea pseudoterrestris]|nr:hypothetical protein MPSEU_000069200 [Mayamaea pseudoterrestris]
MGSAHKQYKTTSNATEEQSVPNTLEIVAFNQVLLSTSINKCRLISCLSTVVTMPDYTIEPASSSRSTCRGKCRRRIAKGTLRIGITTPGEGDYMVTRWYHLNCFPFPRHLSQEGVTEEDFVREHLTDSSPDGSVLPGRFDEVVEALENRHPASPSDEAISGKEKYEQIVSLYEQLLKEGDDETQQEKPAKRKKQESSDAQVRDEDKAMAQAYGKYKGMKVKDLKEVLKWNKEAQTGPKHKLVLRVLDGHVHGRLARCRLCAGGHLVIHDDMFTVACAGAFDELRRRRIPCPYRGTTSECPRWQPWYDREPTPEEEVEMTRLIEEATLVSKPIPKNDPAINKLVEKAKDFKGDLSHDSGIKKATEVMCDLLQKCDREIDLPEDPNEAKRLVGGIIASNRSMSFTDLVPQVARDFGYKETKAKMEAERREAELSTVKCKANAPLVGAFHELVDLSSRQGDRQRVAGAYTRAAEAIRDVDYEITEDNAMGLSKGKTKVPGIGKKNAEHIVEFLKTGTMEKLEKKRAAAK